MGQLQASRAIRPPSWALLFAEPGRAVVEYGLLGPGLPLLLAAPAGDGHPVMVLPGLAADDLSTVTLRAFLASKGYAPHRWRQGMNRGSGAIGRPLRERIQDLRRRYGKKVSLIGWSLGGVYARELAKAVPDDVRCVITLGSPFRGPAEASNVGRIFEMLSGRRIDRTQSDRYEQPPPVPTTAVFSRTDGIVPWQRCIETPASQVENIEVVGSHCGLGHNACAMYAVADRLAQPEGAWRRFEPAGGLRFLFPSSNG